MVRIKIAGYGVSVDGIAIQDPYFEKCGIWFCLQINALKPAYDHFLKGGAEGRGSKSSTHTKRKKVIPIIIPP